MNVLVTGGAGFIGSHLCDYLIAKKHSVICVDNLLTGDAGNVQHLLSHAGFRFLRQDITQPFHLDSRIDFVFNMASPASPPDFAKIPLEIMKVGSFGTFNALEIAREYNSIFVMASTSEIYGNPQQNPQKEEYWGNVNPVGIRSVYDESKRFSEALTMAYHRKYRLDTKIVRIFNTYGPRMKKDDGRVIPNFVTQALEGQPLSIFGDGKQTRSFCFVSDLVDGIYQLALSDAHEPVNLGNPHEITVLQLAQDVLRLTGSNSKLKYFPLPEGDPEVRCPDITRAVNLLRWSPSVPLESGLRETIDWFKSNAGKS